jgi:dienelactone hydrolase
MRRKAISLAIAAVLLVAAGELAMHTYGRGAAFVVQAAGMQGIARTIATWQTVPVSQTHTGLHVPWRGGTLKAYAYQPARIRGRGVMLVPGVHAAGIDEPRLVGFARDLASMGHPVLTVELPDLMRYQITPRTTDMIEDAAAWTIRRPEFGGGDGRIGMMGISFGGGLSVVAAGRPAIRSGVAFAMSFGGHGDLPRTLRYLCTGIQPDGVARPQHDYGLAIVLLGAADRVVPPEQVKPLRDAILSFLEASRLDMVDKEKSALEFEHAKSLEATLAEPSRTYMGYVNARDVKRLGPILLPHMAALGGDPALSPAQSAPPQCPVYLLHGSDDNVVPAIESTLLAENLRGRGVTVHLLATPLITHAEVDRRSTARAIWRLIDFWSDLLDE